MIKFLNVEYVFLTNFVFLFENRIVYTSSKHYVFSSFQYITSILMMSITTKGFLEFTQI